MKKQLLSVIFFLLYSLILVSQASECDVLVKKLQVFSNDFKKLDPKDVQTSLDSLMSSNLDCQKAEIESHLIRGQLAFSAGKYDLSREQFQSALQLVNEDVYYTKLIAIQLGNINNRIDSFQEAIEIMEDALKLPCTGDNLNCHNMDVKLNIQIAMNLRKLNKYDEAITKYGTAEEIIRQHQLKDSLNRASMMNALGNIYDAQFDDYRKSLEYYKNAHNFLPKGHKAKYAVMNNIGNMYVNLQVYDSAYLFYEQTIKEASNPGYLIIPYQALAAIEVRNKNYDKGIEFYNSALQNAISVDRKSSIFWCRIYLTKTNFLNGNFKTARSYLNQAIDSKKGKDIPKKYQRELDYYSHILDVAMLKPELSYKIYQDFQRYDTVAINSRTESINRSVTRYEKLMLRDSLDKAILKEENETQKAKNYKLSSLVLVLGLLLLGGMAMQLKKLLEKQRAKNEKLVFEINEQKSINLQLEEKSKSQSHIVSDSKIKIKSKDYIHILDCNQINYLKAEDFGTRIFQDGTSNWTDSSLKLLKEQLPANTFVQIFRSTIVNIDKLASINTVTLKLKDGTELKIGRTYKRAIKAAVTNQGEE